MKKTALLGIAVALLAPVWVTGQLVLESAPNLAIADGSCLDPADGRGEGGIVDTIAIPGWVLPLSGMKVEVEVDHGWRSDLQMAVRLSSGSPSGASAAAGLLSLNGDASSTPRLADAHDSSADNYYATFDDLAPADCRSTQACGSASFCVAADEAVICRPDEPIFRLLTASATQEVHLRICDREGGIAGVLRRWRVFVSSLIPVELQSFSVD